MNASFHPSDELLVAYGTGSLDEATALLLATHLALCPRCRAEVARVECLGGSLLDDLPPADMADGALAAVLARLETPVLSVSPPRRAGTPGLLPRPLRDYVGDGLESLPWKRMVTGIEQAVILERRGIRARMFRIGSGVAIPKHGHDGMELTLVLQGGFADDAGHYRRGDVAAADSAIVHHPVADKGESCICLAVTDAPLKLTGLVGRLVNPFLNL